MTEQTCAHARLREISTTCYFGPVATGDKENPAAHGGVCVCDECLQCGARRSVNVNGKHVEYGGWRAGSRGAGRDA